MLLLQLVLKLAQNILKSPNDLTKRKFRATNEIIKKGVIEPPGVLELVVEVCLLFLVFCLPLH